jgi:hypothetical protein
MANRLTGVGTEINPKRLAHPTLAFLRDYWNAKRGSRAMPSRADIRPSELKEHLGWVLMIEVFADLSDFRYRLIGTLVTEYFLSDATGKTVTEAFARHGSAPTKAVKALLRKTAREKLPVRAYGDANWIAPGFEEFDALYLPLSDDGETVNMILHGFVFDKPTVMMAREIARAHGGKLQVAPAQRPRPEDD